MRILFCVVFVHFSHVLMAQNEMDIFRYSKNYTFGSARFEAMGGAFGALGADISAAQINPAGLGRFSNSQFEFSLGPSIQSSQADFQNESTTTLKANLIIPSFGVVFVNDISRKNEGNLYSQIGLGMNRIASFNQKTVYTGQQEFSLLDDFASQAYGYYPEELNQFFPFSTSLAWETYALDFDETTYAYYSALQLGDLTKHNREITTKGGMNEWFLSYSVNRLNKLYFGGIISLRTAKYEEKYTHSEDLVDTSDTSLRGFDYEYALKTKGNGVNIKLGVVYLFSEAFRGGLAFHSPTFSSLTDDWTANMTTRFDDSLKVLAEDLVPVGKYAYRLNTPLRLVASAAYVIGVNAVISADVEYVGYQMGRLRSTMEDAYEGYDYKAENAIAKQRLTNGLNYRIGAEYAIQQAYFIRAGFQYYSSAFKKEFDVDVQPDIAISGGLGYRKGKFGLDLAYVNRKTQRTYFAFYNSSARLTNTSHVVTITGSIRF